MTEWRFHLVLDPDTTLPMFLRISRGLVGEIKRGRLKPGARVQGARRLGRQLRVDRGTVAAAFAELVAEGWLTSRPRSGTFVTHNLPVDALEVARKNPSEPAEPRDPARIGFALPALEAGLARFERDHDAREAIARTVSKHKRMLVMAGGVPDLRMLPIAELGRAYRRSLKTKGPRLLDYGDPQGHPRLRAEIASMLGAERSVAVAAEDVVITQGAQEALYLVGQTLFTPGDRVAVEELGYGPAWLALGQRARLTPVRVDAEGIDVDALERLVKHKPIRAVYVTPHHQYPTMATLSMTRRLALAELARKRRFAIIEDDYDHEMHYGVRPIFPMISEDRSGSVVYVGTLSKILAPGLRLGFLVAPRSLIGRLTALRRGLVRQGHGVLEHAVADLFEDGTVARHVKRMRRAYEGRRQHIAKLLVSELGGAVDAEIPAGGMALWLRVRDHIDPELWAARAAERGVMVAPGSRFHIDGRPTPHLRIGYACLREAELTEAVHRLASALPARRRATRSAS